MKKIYSILWIICLLLISLYGYGLTIDSYKARININDATEQMFVESMEIQSEDGSKVFLKKLNPLFDEQKRAVKEDYELTRKTQRECFYFVICQDGMHILDIFDEEKEYLQKHKDTFKLEKGKDYDNVHAYYFKRKMNEDRSDEWFWSSEYNNGSLYLWFDIKNQEYCGSARHMPIEKISAKEPTLEESRCYEYVKDVYCDAVDDLFAWLDGSLPEEQVHDTGFIMKVLVDCLKKCDPEKAEQYERRFFTMLKRPDSSEGEGKIFRGC